MKEFVVYRILKDSKSFSVMGSLDLYDGGLKCDLSDWLFGNDILPEDTIHPDVPTDKWMEFEYIHYDGYCFLKKMQYHVKSSGTKVSFTAQLRYNNE